MFHVLTWFGIDRGIIGRGSCSDPCSDPNIRCSTSTSIGSMTGVGIAYEARGEAIFDFLGLSGLNVRQNLNKIIHKLFCSCIIFIPGFLFLFQAFTRPFIFAVIFGFLVGYRLSNSLRRKQSTPIIVIFLSLFDKVFPEVMRLVFRRSLFNVCELRRY